MSKAIFCKNGHDLSVRDPIHMGRLTIQRAIARAERQRVHDQMRADPFCTQCGAPTVTACEHCNNLIKIGRRPAYCSRCGKPFPWTESTLQAAKDYADELEELDDEDKAILKATFADLTVDSPRTELAASRFKRILRKVGPDASKAVREMIVDVASSTAAKLISGR